jgi:RimJ/RimL family protein N-acetyltransferase
MTSTWDWALPHRDKHFGSPLAGAYPLSRLSREAYWELNDRAMQAHFPPEVFFDFWRPRGEDEEADVARLVGSMGGTPLEDFWVARDGEAVVMMACGHQIDGRIYRMWHTHVHPEYRGKGLYAEYLARMLAYTRDLGFRVVTSEHAPSNNAVIIAKLKAGFRIYALEINAAVGPSLCLRYFHDPVELAAYEYRCGLATMNAALLARGAGAAGKLIEQFRGSTAVPGDGK